MSDILKKIVAIKHEEIALASQMKSFQAVRADAESRVLTRDFVGAIQGKIANQEAAVIAEIKKASRLKVCCARTLFLPTLRKVMQSTVQLACLFSQTFNFSKVAAII